MPRAAQLGPVVLALAACAGILAGLLAVAVPAAALAHDAAADSGLLIAISSAGEIVGPGRLSCEPRG